MCGIAGIFSFRNASPDRDDIRKMTRALAHRGPDGDGIFIEGPVALGHRRLSIIDLEGGAQPMESTNKISVISYNGEVYNFPELRKQLSAQGYRFQTHSDTEVILALYEQHGRGCLDYLGGMFAFTLWDRREQTLLLARDRIGVKPLYYSVQKEGVYFASEIKAIRAVLGNNALDQNAVNSYFSRQYIGGDGTIFQEIKKVLPGTMLLISGKGISPETWWQPTPKRCSFSQNTAQNELDSSLNDAVASHLISDVPVGIFLSGGLDSGCLLAYAAQNNGKALHTFSVGFGEDSPLNETVFARKLAGQFGTIHHEIQVTADEMLQSLPGIIDRLDAPLADYAIIPTYVMSKFAAEHVKVVLSGEGADELFGGYKRYHLYALFDRIAKTGLTGNLWKYRLPGPSLFRDGERRQLLGDGFAEMRRLPSEQKMRADKAAFFPAGHLNSMLFTDIRNYLVDDLLMKVDKMGMLASLEARVPYLDHRLLEFVLSLDGTYKTGLTARKILLKKVAARRLPMEIWQRPKHGFTVPVSDWLKGPLKQRFAEVVFEKSAHGGWINRAFVEKLLKRHQRDDKMGFKLWSIFIFCLWLEKRSTG